MKEETENNGESMADCKAEPLPIVSSELSVLKTSGLLNAFFVSSKMTGVLVASPIISTAVIYSVFKPKFKLVGVSIKKEDVLRSLHKLPIGLE